MKLNLLVLKTHQIQKLKEQYEALGFTFLLHQHGNGPKHYAAEEDGFVFEIYPLPQSHVKADQTTRLGFDVKDLALQLESLRKTDWRVITEVKETEWGLVAVIQDADGRKIELKEVD